MFILILVNTDFYLKLIFKIIIMETSELITKLNEAVKPLYGIKIKDWGNDLHMKVGELIENLLPREMEMHTWYIKYHNSNEDYSDILDGIELFHYEIDFVQDKRSANYNRYGKLNKIWFAPTKQDADLSLPIDEYLNTIRENIITKKIAAYRQSIIETREEAQKSINSYTERIEELSKALALLQAPTN